MKTAEAWVAEIFLAKRSSHEYEKIVRQIQSEVREEAAKIAAKEIGSTRHEIAAAIRKMELP